jgi:hypothetical protein
MKAHEALAIVTSKDGKVEWTAASGLMDVIELALREKAERDGTVAPGLMTQEQMLRTCSDCDSGEPADWCCQRMARAAGAAADTIKVVREDVIPFLRGPWGDSVAATMGSNILRKLGVEP